MPSGQPSLLELQRAFARELEDAATGGASAHVVADGLAPQARLDLYRNSATATLVAALRLSYPAVHALTGPGFFEGACRRFIAQSAPQSAWLDVYGDGFADFLARLPEAGAIDYLPDVARLEWAVSTVLHAPDATPLDLRRLAESDLSAAGAMHFLPHPAVRLVHAAFPVDAIWRAVLNRDDHALARIDPAAGAVRLLVRRTPDGIDVARLGAWQWQFTAALLAGQPLHAALDPVPAADAQAWLAWLLSAGCFIGFGPARAADLPIPEHSP
ncbi:DNA-binding domain-containing protein [Cupriavidus alkaliphilus]|uniref:DNA-binding domain-containing protein n=1 Tax=Cupriavidus alkaliphilus TaxID=942866 RepID=UPI00339DA697